MTLKPVVLVATALAVTIFAGWYFYSHQQQKLPQGFALGNGRIEANELDISTRFAARIVSVDVEEGDLVQSGQIVAHLDGNELGAQLRGAEALEQQARQARDEATFVLAQRRTEWVLAQKELKRQFNLLEKHLVSQQNVDQLRARADSARAAVDAAESHLGSTDSAIHQAQANIDQLQTLVQDTVLTTPRSGRVLYRLAEPGEVLGAGGRIATVLDLSDIYMTIFLPADVAGRIAIGAQARILLDIAPKQVIPAQVSFVSARAQFTPKQVETRSERERMVFRVKLRVPQSLVQKNLDQVKTGVLGIAYVQLDPQAPWPTWLESDLTREAATAPVTSPATHNE